jgi:hypothetical protein
LAYSHPVLFYFFPSGHILITKELANNCRIETVHLIAYIVSIDISPSY